MNKEQFLNRLKNLNLNKMDFAKISEVPYPTINNWGIKRNDKPMIIPSWVEPFLNYYDKATKLDYVTDEICEKIRLVKDK